MEIVALLKSIEKLVYVKYINQNKQFINGVVIKVIGVPSDLYWRAKRSKGTWLNVFNRTDRS